VLQVAWHQVLEPGTRFWGFGFSGRSVEWNAGLARDLRKKAFAQEFIQGCLDEGLSLQQALAKVVRAYGVKEFASKAKLPSSNLLRVIGPGYNPTIETLNTLLKPFDLCLSVTPRRRA
jgi:DNA-binding phage protein